jgi:hypothetical protein
MADHDDPDDEDVVLDRVHGPIVTLADPVALLA